MDLWLNAKPYGTGTAVRTGTPAGAGIGLRRRQKAGPQKKAPFLHFMPAGRVSALPCPGLTHSGPTAAGAGPAGTARPDGGGRRAVRRLRSGTRGALVMTLGNYFISPADGVSNDRGGAQPTRPRTPPSARLEPPGIAPVTEGSAADAPGSHPRAPGARPRTLQARRALRTRGGAGAGNARDSPAARPSSAAAPPPLGAEPSLRRAGTSLAEQRGPSDVPAPSPAKHGGREGKGGSGAGGGAPPAPAPLRGAPPELRAAKI